jgi:hypothetical protein
MKEQVIHTLDIIAHVKHFVASFTDFETDTVYWADRCKCGSPVDEHHQCLRARGAANEH